MAHKPPGSITSFLATVLLLVFAPTNAQQVVPMSQLTRVRVIAPQYPDAAKAQGLEGWVDVLATIEPDGSVSSARATNSSPAGVFEEAALRAVRQWKFAPLNTLQAVNGAVRLRFKNDPPSTSASSSSAVAIPDVSHRFQTMRSATDVEMQALSSTLRWEPAKIPLSLGGTAESHLLDGEGRHLATTQVSWVRVSPTPKKAQFSVRLENRSTCTFTSRAQIESPPVGTAVNTHEWFSWVNLKEPKPFNSYSFERTVPIAENSGNQLMLAPDAPGQWTLAFCQIVDGKAPVGHRVVAHPAPPVSAASTTRLAPSPAREESCSGNPSSEAGLRAMTCGQIKACARDRLNDPNMAMIRQMGPEGAEMAIKMERGWRDLLASDCRQVYDTYKRALRNINGEDPW